MEAAIDTLEDRDLMVRTAEERDREAFGELLRRWDARILAFLVKSTGDPAAAEDLRQEVFLRLFRYAGSYDPAQAFAPWLYRIAVNVVATWQRRQQRRRAVEVQVPRDAQDGSPDPRRRAVRNESAQQARSAIDRLEAGERELLLLRFDLDLNYREIADIVGAPETTVKSRVYAILHRLRQSLEEPGLLERRPNA